MSFSRSLTGVIVAVLLTASCVRAETLADCKAAYDRPYNQQNIAEALGQCRPLAEKGDAEAQRYLGLMYLFGKGVPQDHAEALKWFRKAADQGNAVAQFNLGDILTNEDWHKEFQDVPLDYVEGTKWLRKAADQGEVAAKGNLGFAYLSGRQGVPQDYAEALKWFRKAADQGNVQAQYKIGVMYRDGQGVPQDYLVAHVWLNLAAAHDTYGYGAKRDRDELAAKMTPEQIAEAQRLAREWKPTK
jgi:TPR repeat protein